MPQFVVEVIAGQHKGARFPLAGDMVSVGREHTNIICLEDNGISRRHARFVASDGGWVIEDSQSKNGLRVDDQAVTRKTLKPGSVITIGDARLRFDVDLPEATPIDDPLPAVAEISAPPASQTPAASPASSASPAAATTAATAPAARPTTTMSVPKPAAPSDAQHAAPRPAPLPADESQAIAMLRQAREKIIKEMGKVIIGQGEVIEQILTAMFSRGHCLMVGVPGLAKTLMVRTLSQALDLDSKRIQFTPDLMPSDITGTQILEEDPQTHQRAFRFLRGPIFTHILLADEINRTPPKTQAALLEAMQEGRVTASGTCYHLAQPFFVLATQNPIEQEGTYPLPEAQLDRFMFMIKVGYPTRADEIEIYRATTGDAESRVAPILSGEAILQIQRIVRRVPVSDHVTAYVADLVRATRPDDAAAPQYIKDRLGWGAGPRAGQYLLLAAKARAVLQGRVNVSCEDVRSATHPVLRHRIFCNFNAASEGLDADKVIDWLLKNVPEPSEKDYR